MHGLSMPAPDHLFFVALRKAFDAILPHHIQHLITGLGIGGNVGLVQQARIHERHDAVEEIGVGQHLLCDVDPTAMLEN
jgi:hypothetical protein